MADVKNQADANQDLEHLDILSLKGHRVFKDKNLEFASDDEFIQFYHDVKASLQTKTKQKTQTENSVIKYLESLMTVRVDEDWDLHLRSDIILFHEYFKEQSKDLAKQNLGDLVDNQFLAEMMKETVKWMTLLENPQKDD